MNVDIPIYVEERKPKGDEEPSYVVRPLFDRSISESNQKLSRAINKLTEEIRKELRALGAQARHEDLAKWLWAPDVSASRVKLRLGLRREAKCTFLCATFSALGTGVAFTPSVPNLWFTVDKGETLTARATEVFTAYFRAKEKKEDKPERPEDISIRGRAWLTTIELDIHPAQKLNSPKDAPFAFLGGFELMSGREELDRVGRCLNGQFPDELTRALFMDDLVKELTHFLRSTDKRPVALIGPSGAGKTTLVEECVFRRTEERRKGRRTRDRDQVWLLSPQRLISGMKYVGQWENRLLAILKEAKARNHVLYFDELLGLYHAGVSRQSSLNVAQVLKPYVERGDVRILCEMTHEAFAVLQEQDRGFADLFHVIPVREPAEDETLRILIRQIRQLEAEHRCRFAPEVIPAALDLQRRYVRDVTFPGKACGFLQQIALKHRNADITRDTVLDEFHAKSGLSVAFLDDRTKLERKKVVEALAKEIVGQDAAIQACADVVCIAKAKLNDPDRPLATFLFLGPTGVGKTQCAKALTSYLFGSEESLLRFDMNEFVEPGSAARLVGTFDEPEGLLTSAIRRQPFSVVLLDEIEKAHPDVYDLLLQVLGEGRLTDALGRVADFSNAIIIMTSNLGARDAGATVGFRADHAQYSAVYVRAAERFFRPEFFNRLDRVVPFEQLTRENVKEIARILIGHVFEREGLARRKCMLHVEPQAMEKVVDEGFHPLLGARALKRAIEKELTQPVATALVALKTDTPVVVSLLPTQAGITVNSQGLTDAEPREDTAARLDMSDPAAILERAKLAAEWAERTVAHLKPPGAITAKTLRPEHHSYYMIRDQALRVQKMAQRIGEEIENRGSGQKTHVRLGNLSRRSQKEIAAFWGGRAMRDLFREIFAAEDIREYLAELAASGRPETSFETRLRDLLVEVGLMHAMLESLETNAPDRVLLYSTFPDGIMARGLPPVTQTCREALTAVEGIAAAQLSADGDATGGLLVVEGLHAWPLVSAEAGVHLFLKDDGGFVLINALAIPLDQDEDPLSAVDRRNKERQQWLRRLFDGRASFDDDPMPYGRVIRIYDSKTSSVDLRTGMVVRSWPQGHDVCKFILSSLPLPPSLLA